jgi:ParB-like chromosome segregation protein Spo0J
LAVTSIATVWVGSINPPHGVRDQAKLDTLVEGMRAGGWTGRPLLVERRGDGYQAWTGSHRIAAARKISHAMEVPVVVIDADKMEAAGVDLSGLTDDEDKLAALIEAGDTEAADLMRREIEAN